jgi:pimeloyl-ACP methyl ester carboxylesterase
MAEFQSFDGVKLHYDREGTGPPVVLLHGFAADTETNWRRPGIIEALVGAGHEAIALDARGHGLSEKCYDPDAYKDEAMVSDVVVFFDHLGLESADVVGYSMGSATAIRFAMSDGRVRRLVLGGTDGELSDSTEELAERGFLIAAALEAEDLEGIEDPLGRRFRRFADATGADRRALAAIQRGRRRTPVTPDDISKITALTLVICGDDDVRPHDLAAALPQGRAKVVSGHHLSAVRDPAFTTEIVTFLAEPFPQPAVAEGG